MNINRIYEWPLTLRLLVMGLVSVGVFYLLYLWDITALNNQLLTVHAKEDELKQQLSAILNKQASARKEEIQFKQVKLSLIEWQNKLIHYSELPKLINEILKMGANNHIYFNLFTPGSQIKEGGYAKIPIKIVALGTYHDLARFISDIANYPSIIVINHFILTTGNNKEEMNTKVPIGGDVVLTLEMTIEVYYLAEQK